MKQSFNIDGCAGCGKSHLIREIQERLQEMDVPYITLSPTNKAALNVNGTTIHKFVSKLKNKKNFDKHNYGVMFIDEVSMIKEIFYKFFISYKIQKKDIKFIIVGDFNQLKPINDRVDIDDYKNTWALNELCDGNRIQLTKCRRSDDKLFNLCKFESIMDVSKDNFSSNFTSKHLSYTHKTRMNINKKMMRKMRGDDYIKVGKVKYDEHSQDVSLFEKLPVICKVNNRKLEIVNNEEFIISSVDTEQTTLKNEFKELTIETAKFQKLFYPAYCITIHASQGSTYDEPYTIHDWNLLTNRLRYVALTRGTKYDYINIVNV
jgi:ATP-dependent exoDNAse (exonuclease V) alpha subunit